MSKRLLRVLSVFLLFFFISAVLAEVCPLFEERPVIDGKLDESVWKKAFRSGNFVSLDGSRKAEPDTVFKMYSDGENLYVAVITDISDDVKLHKTTSQRDSILWNETIEVFIAPDITSESYYHFAFTPSGELFDNFTQAQATDHNYDVNYKTTCNGGVWILEASFPLKQLGVKEKLENGDEFAVNICRTTSQTRYPDRHSAWAATGDSFHNRKSFKHVVAGSYSALAKRKLDLTDRILEEAFKVTCSKKTLEYGKLKSTLDALRKKAASINSEIQWKHFIKAEENLRGLISSNFFPDQKLIVSRINPWTMSLDNPVRNFSSDSKLIDVYAMKGEVLDMALAVTNTTGEAVRVRCITYELSNRDLQPARTVAEIYKPGAHNDADTFDASENPIKTYNVVTVGIKGGSTQRDALVEIGQEHTITIMPRDNEVFWFRIDTSELTGGVWRGKISLKPLVKHELATDVFLNLRIIPGNFPKSGKPYSCNWARYINSKATGGRLRKAAMLDQCFTGTNVHILPPLAAGFHSVKFDKTGKPVNLPDFTAMDEYIDVFGNKNQLYVLPQRYDTLPVEFGGNNNNSSQAKENFKWFIGKLTGHLDSRGLSLKDIAWYPVDEPDVPRAKAAIKFNKLLLGCDPGAQIFCTIYDGTPKGVIEILCPYVNIWVPGFNTRQNQLETIRRYAKRKPLRWFSYMVLSRASSPYWAYRLSGYKALEFGYEGIGFWCYDDAGSGSKASTWDDFDGKRSDYAVVYEGNNAPQPSVRWRAWHQAIQSYRYVEWIRWLAAQAKDKKLSAEAIALTDMAVKDSISNKDVNTADGYTDKMRAMATRLLVSVGKIDAKQIKCISSPIEYCLTGNSTTVPNLRVDGRYWHEQNNGNHNKAQNVAGYENTGSSKNDPQKGTKKNSFLNGVLTDNSVAYPDSWFFWKDNTEKMSFIFDMSKPFILSKAFISVDFYPFIKVYKSISVYTSCDKKSWKHVKTLNMVPITQTRLTKDYEIFWDLGAEPGRYVRFDIEVFPQNGHLGEVRIFGWSENTEKTHKRLKIGE